MINQSLQPSAIYASSTCPTSLNELVNFAQSSNYFLVKPLKSCNKLIYYKLNKMLEVCDEEYILRMDSDDISLRYRAEVQLKVLSGKTDVCFSNAISMQTGLNLLPSSLDLKTIIHDLPYRNFICHPSVAMKKSILQQTGGYSSFARAQDLDLWLRLSLELPISSWYFVKQPLLLYSQSSKGTPRKSLMSSWNHLKVLLSFFLRTYSLRLLLPILYHLFVVIVKIIVWASRISFLMLKGTP